MTKEQLCALFPGLPNYTGETDRGMWLHNGGYDGIEIVLREAEPPEWHGSACVGLYHYRSMGRSALQAAQSLRSQMLLQAVALAGVIGTETVVAPAESKALAIIDAIARLVPTTHRHPSGRRVELAADLERYTMTVRIDGAPTHVGVVGGAITLNRLVDDLHGLLCEGRGLSWAGAEPQFPRVP